MKDNEEEEEEKPFDGEAIKVVLIGNSGVGKTCISQRYINNSYDNQDGSTLGASYFKKILEIDEKPVRLDIWDTAGQEKYRAMGKMFYKDAHIVLFIYDITDKKTFLELKSVWYNELMNTGEKHTVLAVVGNKSDLYLNEEVDENEARKWAEEIGAIFGLVSAKTGNCVNTLFESVIKKYFSPDFVAEINKEKRIKNEKLVEIKNKDDKKKNNKKKFC